MEDIVFYSFDFVKKVERARCISVNWTLCYSAYGTFELHLPLTDTEMIKLLDEEDYLICTQAGRQAVITGWRLDEDIAVFGKTPEWLMTKRCTEPMSRTSESSEATARYAVSSAMGDFVTLGTLAGEGTVGDYSTDRVRTVYDIVKEVLSGDRLGFRLYADFDSEGFVFEVYKGEERTVILSQSNKTAHGMSYTKEMQDKVTGGAWYEKKTTDSTGEETTEWVQTDGGTETGARKWNCVLSGIKTEDEAEGEVKTLKTNESIECGVRRLVYGTDYALGDRVRVQFEAENFKKTLYRYVTGVEIYFDTDGCGVRPILEV